MKDTFNLNRIKLLLRADWIEYYKKGIYQIGSVLAGMALYFSLVLYSNGNGNLPRKQLVFFSIGIIVTLIYFCRYAGNKVHRSKGLFLTLPANNLEKYVTILVEGILLLTLFICTFWTGIFIIHIFIPYFPVFAPWEMGISISYLFFTFLFSLFFLSYITFRKHAFVITVAGMAATVAVLVGIGFLIRYILINYVAVDGEIPETLQIVSKNTFIFLKDYHNYLLGAAVLFVFYLAFLKLKRKELR